MVLKDAHFDGIVLSLVSLKENDFLTTISLEEEVRRAVFYLNTNSTLGQDGFNGKCYNYCWDLLVGMWLLWYNTFLRPSI